MATMKRPRLAAVEALADYKLRLTFIDGCVYSVSLTEDFDRFPGLTPLRAPEAFFKAQIIPGEGWAVEWPDLDIQIGADTLWLDAQAQNAPDENTRVFAEWRSKNHLSLSAAAAALGMTPRTISAYGTGKRAVPLYIALACKGWEAEHGKKYEGG
jgi:hypothetical protein